MRVAINGLGRIGRLVLKIGLEKGVNFVAINDLSDTKILAYLLQYDSVYGKYNKKVTAGKGFLKIGSKKIKVFSEKDPENLPWDELKVDVVVESTGFFTNRQGAEKHIRAGAKKVLISAPAKEHDITIVPGVNEDSLKKEHTIISMASCTTNCLAPIAKLLDDAYGIKRSFMTTIHAYTSTQNIVDGTNIKFRRGRAGAINLIPTTTGATTAVIEAIPKLREKIDGLAIRAPIACGSIVDFVAELNKNVTKEQVNKLFKNAAKGKMKGVLEYTEDELVSSDIIGDPHSSIIDGLSTQAHGNLVKVLSWYDNEYGYSARMIDLIKMLGRFL